MMVDLYGDYGVLSLSHYLSPSISLSLSLSLSLSSYLSVSSSLCLCLCLCFCLSVSLSLCLSVSLSLCLSVSLCLSLPRFLTLSVSPSLSPYLSHPSPSFPHSLSPSHSLAAPLRLPPSISTRPCQLIIHLHSFPQFTSPPVTTKMYPPTFAAGLVSTSQ